MCCLRAYVFYTYISLNDILSMCRFCTYFCMLYVWSYGLAFRCRCYCLATVLMTHHDDVIKWKHFPRYWPFVRGIHRSPVNSPHKGQWRGALMFSLICVRINGWVNNGEAGDLRRYRAHFDGTVMCWDRHCVFSIKTSNFNSKYIPCHVLL